MHKAFRAMIWCGLSNIWTRCVAVLPSPTFRLSHRRLSMVSTLRVPASGSAYANSGICAALGGYSQNRIQFYLPFLPLVPTHSPREVLATCTKGILTVQRFVSNGYGCI